MIIDTDIGTTKRLFVGDGNPEILGRDNQEISGSAYIEGPAVIGGFDSFEEISEYDSATVMISETKNSSISVKPLYSLIVKTFAKIKGYLRVDNTLSAQNILAQTIYTEVLRANIKNFQISHPSKENKYLIHSCLEGPENGVYIRGRIQNQKVILLPDYWKNLVDLNTITVNLQPIGNFQNLIVKKITITEILIDSSDAAAIDCFYHIFAERIDVPKLKIEIDK